MNIANNIVQIIAPSNNKFHGKTTKHSNGIKTEQKKGIKQQSIILFVGKRRKSKGNISQNTYTFGTICFLKLG